METPVRAAQDGVRFDPDKMEGERLYHCMFGGKLVLVFKDTQDFVHCYEVEDQDIVRMAESAPQGGIDEVLEAYISNTLNKKPPEPSAGQELSESDKTKDAEEILSEFASKRGDGCCSGGHDRADAAEKSSQVTGGGGCCSGGHDHAGKGGSFDVVQISSGQPRTESAGAPDSDQGTSAPEQGTERESAPEVQEGAPEASEGAPEEKPERNVIFVGTKPIMTYINATLQQMASYKVVTIKARGKRITQAVDVSQMIVKRMNAVGYTVSDVRISSDSLKSQDGRERNVSTIELDIARS